PGRIGSMSPSLGAPPSAVTRSDPWCPWPECPRGAPFPLPSKEVTRMIRLGKLLPALATLAGLALAGSPARAGIGLAPGPSHPTIAPVPGGFKWTYNVQVPGALNVQPGDSFTIIDFAGFKDGTAFAPTSDWTFSSALVGPADPHHILNPADD